MYINTGGKVLGLGDEIDGYDPEADYSTPPNNPIVAPPGMPDWNSAAGTIPLPVYRAPSDSGGIGNANAGDKTIVNNGGGGGGNPWAVLGTFLNPIAKAAVPLATAAGTRAILGSTAVVDPKTGLPMLSQQTGQPLFANGSGGVTTNPNSKASAITSTGLLIGAAAIALVLLLKKK